MKDWYLNIPTPNVTSGYENDALSEYAQSNFTDILLTDMADTVSLYDTRLTTETQIKAIIQGSTQNSQLKNSEGTMLVPIGTCESGMYINFEDCFWLITSQPRNNKSYEKVIIEQCNYILKWQNASGTVIERNCVESRISTVGIDENKVIQIGKKQSKILLPYDLETIKLRVGKRFYIDNNTENPTPYEITLANTTQYVKNGHGYLEFVVTETATIPAVDRPDLMLCNYISPTIPPDPEPTTKTYIASISYTQPEISAGSKFGRNFTAVFKDTDGNAVTTLTPKWTITADFMEKITSTEGTNYIKIVIMDTSLIDETFKLKLEATDDSAEPIEMTILITSIYG